MHRSLWFETVEVGFSRPEILVFAPEISVLNPEISAPTGLQRLHFEWSYKYPSPTSAPTARASINVYQPLSQEIQDLSLSNHPKLLIFWGVKEKAKIYYSTEAFSFSPSLAWGFHT